jgi:hypothetical protein
MRPPAPNDGDSLGPAIECERRRLAQNIADRYASMAVASVLYRR